MRIRAFEKRSPMPASAEALYAYHAAPGAFVRLSPPWEPARILSESGPFETRTVTLRVGPFPGVRWVAQHGDAEPGRRFTDRQLRGPFAQWTHTHHFEPHGHQSALFDSIRYVLPFGPLGELGAGVVARKLERMFAYRHAVTAADLARHAKAPGVKLTVQLEGGDPRPTEALGAFLRTGGHSLAEDGSVTVTITRRGASIRRPEGALELRWPALIGHGLSTTASTGAWLALDDAIGATHHALLHPELLGARTVVAEGENGLREVGFVPRMTTLAQARAFELGT